MEIGIGRGSVGRIGWAMLSWLLSLALSLSLSPSLVVRPPLVEFSSLALAFSLLQA
jgi:hypothetical protein